MSQLPTEIITPETARAWLKSNNGNRPIDKRAVRRYAEAMARGEWLINGDTIRFSAAGKLLDGQHRLSAIIEANTPIECVIVRGLDDNVFETIDQGKRRSVGDVLFIDGYKYRNELGATLGLIYYNKMGGIDKKEIMRPTIHQLIEILNSDEARILESVQYICAMSIRGALVSRPISAYIHYQISKRGYIDQANKFFAGLYKGFGLEEKSPILLLRNHLISVKGKNGLLFGKKYTIAIVIKTWNAYIQCKRNSVTRYDNNDPFPGIYIPSIEEYAQARISATN